jgi:hypothetical protein
MSLGDEFPDGTGDALGVLRQRDDLHLPPAVEAILQLDADDIGQRGAG